MTQTLPLFGLLPATHSIAAENIPARQAIADGRQHIVITKTVNNETTRFALPVQWTPREAAYLLNQIRGVTWQLNSEGVPTDYAIIRDICEAFCQSELNEIAPYGIKS